MPCWAVDTIREEERWGLTIPRMFTPETKCNFHPKNFEDASLVHKFAKLIGAIS